MTEEVRRFENLGPTPQAHERAPVERLLIARPQDDAEEAAAGSELEDLPGVVSVTLNTLTRSFDVIFDSAVVSDDELAAALHHQGYDLVSWQEARELHAAEQRSWLLEQIRSLASRTELEYAERGPYAEGVTKGSVDAYVRAARAFGLVTDDEIIRLVPRAFLEGPD
jgi:copper chaperone CopZ